MTINFDEFLDIDIDSGKCFWKKVSKNHNGLIGKEAGTPTNSRGKSYQIIHIEKKAYRRSYIIFWKKYGKFPDGIIDHINGNSLDDRIENLRDVSYQINSQNRKTANRGKILPIGVREGYRNKHGKCSYCARITHLGKTITLGSFRTAEEASEAYQLKQKEFI